MSIGNPVALHHITMHARQTPVDGSVHAHVPVMGEMGARAVAKWAKAGMAQGEGNGEQDVRLGLRFFIVSVDDGEGVV
jgi:hypothetical protein